MYEYFKAKNMKAVLLLKNLSKWTIKTSDFSKLQPTGSEKCAGKQSKANMK